MASVALHSNSNYYSQSWNAEQSESSKEAFLEPRPALGQGTSGLFNLYSVPRDFILSIEDQARAGILRDTEGSHENWLKMIEAPFNIAASAFSAIDTISKVLIYFQAIKPDFLSFMPQVSKKMPFIGLIVCSIESLIEMQGFSQAYSVLKHMPDPLKMSAATTDQQMFKSLMWLNQEYCKRNTETDALRSRSLSRRLYPKCAQKIQALVPQLIQEFGRVNFQDRSFWRKRTCALLKDVKTQSQKKLLMHIAGLAAAFVTIAGLTATLCLCPWATVLALMIVGGVFSTIRYGISEGMMHKNGWTFDAENLIPESVKSLSRKIFMRCVAQDSVEKGVLSRSL
jgi:hypothetical protein